MEIAKGNWIGFDTVFYHEKTSVFGTSVEDVIDYGQMEIDPKGLAAYLDYGYCVFGHTPVKHVKYLLPHESLHIVEGKLQVKKKSDSIESKLGVAAHVDDVLGMLEDRIQRWASSFGEDILIPTSGGFDSRLMNVLVKDKSRIRSYTYGTSFDQGSSREAVYAQLLSKRLGTYWQRIDLGQFNKYIPDWYNMFGPTVGASGTYHMEFYEKIQAIENPRKLYLLSGIIGDAWAGAVSVPEITGPDAYLKLGYTHGMSADASRALSIGYQDLIEPIYEEQRNLLSIPEYRIIAAMRTKMMLLQYLIKVPSAYGFEGYSPFIEEDIALSMLNLPTVQKANRKWQRDFFKQRNLLFEEEKHRYTYQNSLNYYALLHERLDPLDTNLLREVIDPSYLEWVNMNIAHIGNIERIFQTLMHTPKVKEVLKRMGFKNNLLEAYFAYITIKPIEILLSKRNAS